MCPLSSTARSGRPKYSPTQSSGTQIQVTVAYPSATSGLTRRPLIDAQLHSHHCVAG